MGRLISNDSDLAKKPQNRVIADLIRNPDLKIVVAWADSYFILDCGSSPQY
jgi:hypothetical protein